MIKNYQMPFCEVVEAAEYFAPDSLGWIVIRRELTWNQQIVFKPAVGRDSSRAAIYQTEGEALARAIEWARVNETDAWQSAKDSHDNAERALQAGDMANCEGWRESENDYDSIRFAWKLVGIRLKARLNELGDRYVVLVANSGRGNEGAAVLAYLPQWQAVECARALSSVARAGGYSVEVVRHGGARELFGENFRVMEAGRVFADAVAFKLDAEYVRERAVDMLGDVVRAFAGEGAANAEHDRLTLEVGARYWVRSGNRWACGTFQGVDGDWLIFMPGRLRVVRALAYDSVLTESEYAAHERSIKGGERVAHFLKRG